MKNILDPVNQWLGAPPLALASQTNKRPITVDDTVSLLQDSGPVSIDVMANDSDPEGQPLILVSAVAALGTAVAETNGTVTYTPIPGFSGTDTIVYTIADDLGQTRDGQVNVSVTEPQLSIATQADNTMIVNAETGQIDITVTNPIEFAGSYQANTNDLSSGPINLVPPTLTGTVDVGQVLTANPGLWIYDVGEGVPTQGWQWRLADFDIAGENAATYTVQSGDIGPGLSVRDIQTASNGQRFADSARVGQTFQPTDDSALLNWWDASDAATIVANAGAVSLWSDKAGSAVLAQSFGPEQPQSGTRSLNGLNVLDFDGTQRMLTNMTLPASGNIAFHVALVIDGISNAFAALFSLEANNDFQLDANNASAFDGRLNLAGVGTSANLSGGPFSGGLIVSIIFDRTGAAVAEVYVANQQRGSTGYTAALDSTAAFHLMSNRSLNANIDGAVAEVIITADIANRTNHHAYLASKWGLV